jgi:hypothetical protein
MRDITPFLLPDNRDPDNRVSHTVPHCGHTEEWVRQGGLVDLDGGRTYLVEVEDIVRD